jgi:hypothetical protein
MKMKQMLLALLVCLLASCGGGSQKTSDEMTISMKTNVPVEELVKDATLIPLETTDDCLLGDLEKIYESDGRLYILDMNRTTVFVFDISGKFLYKIERRGQGPEEYLEVSDFDVMDGVIYVLSRVNKRILAYDENGECVKIIPLKAWYDNLAVEEERVILYANRGNDYDEILAWDHLDYAVSKDFLIRENKRAKCAETTPNCREKCSACGANCYGEGVCFEKR